MRGLLRSTAAVLFAVPALAGPTLHGRSGNNQDRCNHDNPFKDVQVYANYRYASKVQQAVDAFTAAGDADGAAAAKIIQKTPTFIWLSSIYDVSYLEPYLLDAKAIQDSTGVQQTIPLVVYDLPGRDCAALASQGELDLSIDSVNAYKTQFIDEIVSIMRKYLSLRYVIVLEPDSLANLVTNLHIDACANAAAIYKTCVAYAISQLQDKNVAVYLDIGHSNWLGWSQDLQPTAELFAEVKKWAGQRTNKWRGFVSNVANYNAYNSTTADKIYGPGPDNSNWNEWRFYNALTPYFTNLGLPTKFMVDQSRSGQMNIRSSASSWCNVNNAGLGTRPTTVTGDCNVDAIVWVKPPGESDGTSDSSAPRFDASCINADAFQPAPQAGDWNEAYIEMLIKNANPPF
ncbi:Exoglucanase-6A [Arthrobotrys entomopaga]|nr:Exoglucanase-6A [Arthrobotrys entomopaga]